MFCLGFGVYIGNREYKWISFGVLKSFFYGCVEKRRDIEEVWEEFSNLVRNYGFLRRFL